MLSYGTPILTPDGPRPVEALALGDRVLAASLKMAGSTLQLSWSAQRVVMSSGTPPVTGTGELVVMVQYGAGLVLICGADALLLLPSGKLKRAGTLVPNERLVGKDGEAVTIQAVQVSQFRSGVHEFATDAARGVDGHLVLANGVVCGDYDLQLRYVDDTHADLPVIGTRQFSPRSGS